MLWAALDTERRAIGRTRPQEDAESPIRSPMMLHVRYSTADPFRSNPTGEAYLLTHDAPGEEIAGDQQQRAKIAPYLVHASVLVFFVDLLQVTSIRDRLDGRSVPDDYRNAEFSPFIINDCARLINEYASRMTGSRISKPAIVVLSKGDLLARSAGDLATFLDGRQGRLAELPEEENSWLAKEIVRAYMEPIYAKVETNYSDVHYFLASALGQSPRPDGRIDAPAPWGCDFVFKRTVAASLGLG